MKIIDVFSKGTVGRTSLKLQRLANSLGWRQIFQNSEVYPYQLEDGRLIEIYQLLNGEMHGHGTGAHVWPAAHVLTKFIEKHFDGDLSPLSRGICDLGCGTGITGLVVALCGGKRVVLTDQECILPLTIKNISVCHSRHDLSQSKINAFEYNWGEDASKLSPPFDLLLISDCILPKLYPIEPLVQAISLLMDENSVCFISYEHRVYPYYDPRQEFRRLTTIYGLVVKIIPINQHHDVYCSEDIEIWEVKRRRSGSSFNPLPPATEPSRISENYTNSLPGQSQTLTQDEPMQAASTEPPSPQENTIPPLLAPLLKLEPKYCEISSEGNIFRVMSPGDSEGAAVIQVGDMSINIFQHITANSKETLTVGGGGYIGCSLWSSSIVLSRHILDQRPLNLSHLPRNPWEPSVPPPPHLPNIAPSSTEGVSVNVLVEARGTAVRRRRALELVTFIPYVGAVGGMVGAGCGLTSIALCLAGYDVTATDKAEVLGLLQHNIKSFQQQLRLYTEGIYGSISVREFDWITAAETDASTLMRGLTVDSDDKRDCSMSGSGESDVIQELLGFDLIVMSDCLYSSSSVEPLANVLKKLSGKNTVLLLANEMRSALDHFFGIVRRESPFWFIQNLGIVESDALIEMEGANPARPSSSKPVQLAIGCISLC